MKTYFFNGKIHKARSKAEVLRRHKIPVNTETCKRVIKISKGKFTAPLKADGIQVTRIII